MEEDFSELFEDFNPGTFANVHKDLIRRSVEEQSSEEILIWVKSMIALELECPLEDALLHWDEYKQKHRIEVS